MPDPASPAQPSGAAPLFGVRGLVKAYAERRVLDGLDFDVERGRCLVILGRSGSGKSVTLRLLNGLEPADAGSITFDGQELAGRDEDALAPVRRRMAMLFQSGALFDSMTVFDNVAFPLREHTALDPEAIAEKVHATLAMVRLQDLDGQLPAALSGGMRKRVALARSLVLDPEAVLFDEPTTGLDPITSATIAQLIRDVQRRLRVTSVVVTHDLALARRVGDQVAFLEAGRFRFQGSWAAADRCDDPLLAAFLAGREEDEDVP